MRREIPYRLVWVFHSTLNLRLLPEKVLVLLVVAFLDKPSFGFVESFDAPTKDGLLDEGHVREECSFC